MSDSEFETGSIEELVSLRLCPAYLVEQKSLFDRCIPSFALLGNSLTTTVDGDSVAGNTTEFITGEVNNDDIVIGEYNHTEEYHEYNMSSYHDGTHKNITIEFVPKSDDDKKFDIVAIHGVIKKKYKEKDDDDHVVIGEHGAVLSEETGSGVSENRNHNDMVSPSAYDLYDATGSLSDLVINKVSKNVQKIA